MVKKKVVSKLKKAILTVSIALIFVFFVGYGIETFYPSPKYDDYCDERPVPVKLDENKSRALFEEQENCRKEYEAVEDPYERNVFFITLIIGTLAIIIGGVVLNLESVGSGIMGGGTLTVIYGTMRYWGQLQDVIRFLILGLVLAILIWIGYKKFKE